MLAESSPLGYLIRVCYGWNELWVKYTLPPVRRRAIIGLVDNKQTMFGQAPGANLESRLKHSETGYKPN